MPKGGREGKGLAGLDVFTAVAENLDQVERVRHTYLLDSVYSAADLLSYLGLVSLLSRCCAPHAIPSVSYKNKCTSFFKPSCTRVPEIKKYLGRLHG